MYLFILSPYTFIYVPSKAPVEQAGVQQGLRLPRCRKLLLPATFGNLLRGSMYSYIPSPAKTYCLRTGALKGPLNSNVLGGPGYDPRWPESPSVGER